MTPQTFLGDCTESSEGSLRRNLQFFLLLGGRLDRPAVSSQSGEPGPPLPYWPNQRDPATGVAFTTSLTDVARVLGERGLSWTIVATPGVNLFTAWVGTPGAFTNADGATAPMALCRAWAMHMMFTAKET